MPGAGESELATTAPAGALVASAVEGGATLEATRAGSLGPSPYAQGAEPWEEGLKNARSNEEWWFVLTPGDDAGTAGLLPPKRPPLGTCRDPPWLGFTVGRRTFVFLGEKVKYWMRKQMIWESPLSKLTAVFITVAGETVRFGKLSLVQPSLRLVFFEGLLFFEEKYWLLWKINQKI